MQKYKIIANPTAGSGTRARAIPQIERLLTKYTLDSDIVRTQLRPPAAASGGRRGGGRALEQSLVAVAVGRVWSHSAAQGRSRRRRYAQGDRGAESGAHFRLG
jgi:hypothetical protein